MEERDVGKKGKSPKQDLTSTKDLTIELPEGCESPYHRLHSTQYTLRMGSVRVNQEEKTDTIIMQESNTKCTWARKRKVS